VDFNPVKSTSPEDEKPQSDPLSTMQSLPCCCCCTTAAAENRESTVSARRGVGAAMECPE
jgi:hypothetical protein